ncbi:MAG TPA: CcmD family protein [Ktedonobacteraceae bacterium]|jgi:CcmD family protein
MPQGFPYLAAAYIVVWIGLLLYLGFLALRMHGVRSELAAVEELLREQQGDEHA